MHWVDVAGPPGAGKSTLCDALWGPHDIEWQHSPPPPEAWHDFCNEIHRLFHLIGKHPTLKAAIRMNRRSIRKISTVARMESSPKSMVFGDGPFAKTIPVDYPYIQTALAQRGLGFGWRLADMDININELRHYFRLMPVSIGVAIATAPAAVIQERNRKRLENPATAHENRSHMVPLMEPAISVMIDELDKRKAPIIEIDTTRSLEDARGQLVEFATAEPFDASQGGSGNKVSVLSPPVWW